MGKVMESEGRLIHPQGHTHLTLSFTLQVISRTKPDTYLHYNARTYARMHALLWEARVPRSATITEGPVCPPRPAAVAKAPPALPLHRAGTNDLERRLGRRQPGSEDLVRSQRPPIKTQRIGAC